MVYVGPFSYGKATVIYLKYLNQSKQPAQKLDTSPHSKAAMFSSKSFCP